MNIQMLNKITTDLKEAVEAVCPIKGIYIGQIADKSTWGFHASDSANQSQQTAAQNVITNFDLAVYQDGGSIAVLEEVYNQRKAAYPEIGDQLDALMKGLDAASASLTLPQDTLDWIAACKAVKAQYPKP